MDVLLSSGEQVTSALLSGALTKIDVKAKSWLNWQIPILTEGEHTNSRIVNINVEKINEYLDKTRKNCQTNRYAVKTIDV